MEKADAPGAPLFHYYIYYRIDLNDAEEMEQQVLAMQARLNCRTGIAGRLLKKNDGSGTWMEVYENVVAREPFETALAHALAYHDLEIFLPSGSRRHMEVFTGPPAHLGATC